jgi:hypothetical protein
MEADPHRRPCVRTADRPIERSLRDLRVGGNADATGNPEAPDPARSALFAPAPSHGMGSC